MYYPEHIIEQIREESDIVALISEYIHLSKRGNNYIGLCPFHHEKTPSFSVSEDKKMYYCFGCGAGGNIITFVMEKENLTFVEALTFLAEKLHIDLSSLENTPQNQSLQHKKNTLLEIHRESARYFYSQLVHNPPDELLTYLEKRQLTSEIIKQFGIGYAPSSYNSLYLYLKEKGYEDTLLLESGLILKGKTNGNLYDRFHHRLMFPIFQSQKQVIAFGGRSLQEGQMPKYLNSPESLLFHKSNTLYGLHLARTQKHPFYILVEGYMDVIAMHKAGFPQTVASLGTAFTLNHAKLLKKYTPAVIILYDSDAAGTQAALRAIPLLLEAELEVKVLQLKDAKDPDEFLTQYGEAAMATLLNQAKSYIWFQIGQLEKRFDLNQTSDKINFLKEVAQLIARLESTIEQTIYTKEISQVYQIEQKALTAEIQKYAQLLATNREMKKKVPVSIYKEKDLDVKAQTTLLSTLYHYPAIYHTVSNFLYPELFLEGVLQTVCKVLIAYLKEGTPVDLGTLQTQFSSVAEQRILSNVFMNYDKRYEDEITLQKMLTDTIKHLNNVYIEKQLKQTKDIMEIQNLLIRKKALDKLYIEAING
jgi:DNA primase